MLVGQIDLNASEHPIQTIEATLPDGDDLKAGHPSAWLTSLFLHLVFLLTISFITKAVRTSPNPVLLTTHLSQKSVLAFEDPKEFEVEVDATPKIGARSDNASESARSLAPDIGAITPEIPTTELTPSDLGPIEYRPAVEPVTGMRISDTKQVKGAVGFGLSGAEGAIDRITKEILLSMEQRKTLVVWFFDQSGSLTRQRKSIHERIDRIYQQLGVAHQDESPIEKPEDAALLSSVIAFGDKVSLATKEPTQDVQKIKRAIHEIEQDDSGIEKVFSALQLGITQYKSYRRRSADGFPDRNILFVVFTDEAGNDQHLLDQTVAMCTNLAIPVYVVGAPAPFGRKETIVKWVDPDPKFDQTPRWGSVDQGPESYQPELLIANDQRAPLDSGFGPYSLTRLAYETSGLFFAVHPNRELNRRIHQQETAPFSAHLSAFFDPDTMKKYRPDYVSHAEYTRRAASNSARATLLKVARQMRLPRMRQVPTRFVKRDEASLATALSESQKAAAKLAPVINRLHEILQAGENDRDKELRLRWQAGYDLAYGQVLAEKSRTESYNMLLARAKQGMKFKDPENNTWVLRPSSDFDSVGGQVPNYAKQAEKYLKRVLSEHAGTPWAHLASQELRRQLVWKWHEDKTDLNPRPRNPGPGNNPNPPPNRLRNDKKRVLPRKLKSRPVPKL